MPSVTNTRPRLTREEAIGLIVAALAHAALIAWLALDPPGKPVTPPPERMTVTLSDDSAPQATSPEPLAQPAPATAPEAGDTVAETEADEMVPREPAPAPAAPTPPAAVPVRPPAPKPEPVVRPSPRPVEKAPVRSTARPSPKTSAKPKVEPAPKPSPKPAIKPAPKPTAKATPKPKPPAKASTAKASTAKASAEPKPTGKATAKPTPQPSTKASPKAAATGKAARGDGASRIGSDFLKGVPDEQASGRSAAPKAAAGPQVAASLSQAIARQLKPHWTAPQGADADKLVTVLAWNLNADGSLAGRPRLVSQSGVTEANRAQKDRHAEQAIRAVQLAAPFRLPEQHYASWRRVAAFRFDRKLAR